MVRAGPGGAGEAGVEALENVAVSGAPMGPAGNAGVTKALSTRVELAPGNHSAPTWSSLASPPAGAGEAVLVIAAREAGAAAC